MANTDQGSDEIAYITLELNVIQGRNLVAKDSSLFSKKKSSDPYIEIYYNGKKYGETKVVKKTLSPQWNQSFTLILGTDDVNHALQGHTDYSNLSFRLVDKDLKDDDLMGEAIVALPVTESTVRPLTSWYPVGPGKDKYSCPDASGEIQVALSLSQKKMLEKVRGRTHPIPSDTSIVLQWLVEDGQKVDLNISSVAIDNCGNMIIAETVGFGGNLSNSNKSICHTGETYLRVGGMRKMINCNLKSVPGNVSALYFIATVNTVGKTFKDVKSASVSLVDTGETQNHSVTSNMTLCKFDPGHGEEHSALYLMRAVRNLASGLWKISIIDDRTSARDFGQLIPEIKGYSAELGKAP